MGLLTTTVAPTASRLWFNPAHVSGLYAWYRANTGVTLGGTPLATGTTPPVVTIAATDGAQPTASGLRIEITTGGARGTALFKWSVNDGNTYEATGVATAATVVLASANITVSFAVGTYNTDNVYRSKLAQWDDRQGGAYHLTQATAANHPVRNPRDTTLNNRPSVEFDGSNDMVKAATASDWTFLHNGAGMTVVIAIRFGTLSNSCVFDTGPLRGATPGIYLSARANGDLWFVSWNSTPVQNFALTPVGALSANTAYVLSCSLATSAAPDGWVRKNGTELANGNVSAAASASDPANAVAWGATSTATMPCMARIAEICIYNRQLSATEVADVERYMGREYGITVA